MNYINFRKNILIYDVLSSTNSKAKELLEKSDLSEGTAIIAKAQYAGRGYHNSYWESSPGKNVTVSYILKPDFIEPQQQFWITKVVALAVKKTIESFTEGKISVYIKWPNDIYVENKKIAGILIENSILGSEIKYSIVGIGININQDKFESDAPNPVSLKNILKKEISLDKCYDLLTDNLQYFYNFLKNFYFEELDKQYLSSLYRKDQWADFICSGKKIKAMIKGINEYGKLEVLMPDNRTVFFDFKEISYVIF